MNQLPNPKSLRLLAIALACFAFAPIAHAAPPPKPEDRGGGNSAAENVSALNPATTGTQNTAHGWFSLFSDTTGSFNTADGFQTLHGNTTGDYNTANGYQALYSNTAGTDNTAGGDSALFNNTTGDDNTAHGFGALYGNATGLANTGDGAFALFQNMSGSNNTAVGNSAGYNVITASNVTCIGANVYGAEVSNTTWIGNVYGVTTQSGTTAPVVVSDDGQLGTVASSQRFKKDINAMEKASEAILSLRPVTFHYKSDTKSAPQFGLIAEEVAKVNPALVLPDKEGKPYAVRYDAVNAMLLNEFLKEHATVQELKNEIAALKAGLQKVSAQLEASKPAPQVVNNP
jgi:hypothetical protein